MANKFGKGFKEEAVIFDPVNNAVWISGKGKGGKPAWSRTRHFKTQKQGYAIARKLSLRKKIPIYDRYEEKTIKPRKTSVVKRAIKNRVKGFGLDFSKFRL